MSVQPSHTSSPTSRRPVRPATVPTPGSGTAVSAPSGVRTLTSLTACRLRSTTSRPSASRSTSSSTAPGSSGTTVVHTRGDCGSAAHSRPRGASRSVSSRSRPSGSQYGAQRASTPTCTSSGGPPAVRSNSHTSSRGAVPALALTTSHRPSRDTAQP